MFFKLENFIGNVEKYPHVERKLGTVTEKGWVKINGVEIRDKIDICYQPGLQENMLTTEADILFLGGEPGSGKGEPLDSMIVTPFGHRRMGDLEVGSIISGSDGSMQKVIQIHELGERDVYRLKFADGTYTDCTEDHIWVVKRMSYQRKKRQINGTGQDDDWQKWDMKMIMNYLDNDPKFNLAIPLSDPIKFTLANERHRTIDPYILGCLLGDGCITGSAGYILMTSMDEEIIDSFKKKGIELNKKNNSDYDYICKDKSLRDKLKAMKLYGTYSYNKFIPHAYIYAPVEDRISILAGLIDTDGYIAENGSAIVYTTTSLQLAKDVQSIVFSLGGRATVSEPQRSGYKNSDDLFIQCRDHYDVYIQIEDNKRLTRLTRKKERLIDYNSGVSDVTRRIVGYEYVGKDICRCISVSNPDSLYLTGQNYALTHNTFGILLAALQGVDKKGYSGLIIKKELVSTKDTAGGMMQDAKIVIEEFADCQFRSSDNPTFIFPTWGSAISFTHSNFESTTEKRAREAQERAKNFQCSFIAFDELTNFSFDNWWYWTSRNRDSSGMKSKMICTFNTNSHHFTRTLIDWYIGEDGKVIPERIGKIRYFYKQGETERDFVWGDSKEEVIRKADLTIRKDMLDAGVKPETLVKSFTFMPSLMMDNRILINATEGGHVANIANMGGVEKEKLFDSNWNTDTSGNSIVTKDMIRGIFKNEGIEDETMYATLDVSGGGDNCVMIIWKGLIIKHILNFDGLTGDRSQFYKELEVWIDRMLTKYEVSVYNFAFDASGNGQYLKSYTNGRPIVGNTVALTEYDDSGNKAILEQYFNLRSQLMGKTHYLLDMGMIGCDVDPKQLFKHGRNKVPRELEEILCEEADVFMRTTKGNKYYFRSKDEFKEKYRYSPDFIDPIVYRAIFELDQSKRKEVKKEYTILDYIY